VIASAPTLAITGLRFNYMMIITFQSEWASDG
jgi:hypothetical protein